MRPLLIGLVGCGQWGELVLRDLKALGCTVVVAVRSGASIARAKSRGADGIVSGIGELPLALDGAVVVTPTDVHGDSIEALLPRGCPIFVEKAFVHDPVQGRRIVEAAGARVFVMDKWRYHPGVEAMRRLSADGRLGRIRGLRSIRWGWSTRHHELDPVWLLLPHDLAITLHILGHIPEPKSASADPLGPRGSGIVANLGGDGGPTAVLDVSSVHPVTRRSVLLVGEEGTAQLGGSYEDEIILRRGPPAVLSACEERLALPGSMPLLAELECFLAHLRGGPAPMSSAREGLAIVETIVALRKLAWIDT